MSHRQEPPVSGVIIARRPGQFHLKEADQFNGPFDPFSRHNTCGLKHKDIIVVETELFSEQTAFWMRGGGRGFKIKYIGDYDIAYSPSETQLS